MKLQDALNVPDRGIVAFVGGGGKTSALYRLAAELAAPGQGRVLLTPTTKMLLPGFNDADGLFIHPSLDAIAERLQTSLPFLRRVAIAPQVIETADGWKLDSVPPHWPGRLARMPRVAAVLVEADGSRHLSFKAPALHEPPIPPDADVVVLVLGLDVLGQPLDGAHVHRPERVAALTGLAPGAAVTVEVVAVEMSHPEGGLKNIPAGARVVALLNKVSNANMAEARHLARRLLASPRFDGVAIGAVQAETPVREVRRRVGAVILAAGGATRYGALKQALPWGDTTLVGRAVDVALASDIAESVLVVGAGADEVRAAAGNRVTRIAHNPYWEQGLSTSVRAGLTALAPATHAALFMLADQPQVTPAIVDALLQRYSATLAPIVVATYGGRRGNPTLFDRRLWPELMQITGDQGGRTLIEKHRDLAEFVEVGEAATVDIDTPDDYRRLVGNG
ncbi:MAG: selenium cofactor biosynthesis protein YqeC [Anaerolineae bacterium]